MSVRARFGAFAVGVVACVALLGGTAVANHEDGSAQSFTTLQAPFTQDLFGTGPEFFGGVAFAPDGDPAGRFLLFQRQQPAALRSPGRAVA